MILRVGLGLECKLNFSGNILDQLILKTKAVFRNEGIPGFLSFLIHHFDREICSQLLDSEEWTEFHIQCLGSRCCETPKLEKAKREKKNVITTLGKISVKWVRLRCRNCKESRVPMRSILGMEKYQGESQEFVKLACETIVEQSYRRAKKHLSQIGGIKITHTKLHRIIMGSDCDKIDPDMRSTPINYLIADGTGFPEFRLNTSKKQFHGKSGDVKKPPKSEIRTVIGINDKNEIIPIGVWSKKSWSSIRHTIQKANHHPKLKPVPIADLLICDGEESLVRQMGKLTRGVQRCQWHVPHDFFHLMRYQENVDNKIAGELTEKLYQTIHIENPSVKSTGTDQELNRVILKAETSLQDLIYELRIRRFKKAAVYLENAKRHLFTYLRYWLATGILPPKASSRIERLMREFKRRIKKIGFNWSHKGVVKITSILLKLLASETKWEAEWNEKLGKNLDLSIQFKGVGLIS